MSRETEEVTSGPNKRIALKLEFYLIGKARTPSVGFTSLGQGVPMTAHNDAKQAAIFSAFSNAAYRFCRELKDAGELE